MIIIPAIDIKDGKCIRLTQGDFAAQTIYSDDPLAMAQKWESEGARMLHIVDLDGAKSGNSVNYAVIKKIANAVSIPVQVGGGIQSEEAVEEMLSAGVKRIILGTLALENEPLLKALISQFSDQVIVSLDSKNGKLVKKGWLEEANVTLIETAKKLEQLGVKRFIYTNVLKDGTLAQPDYEGVQSLLDMVNVSIIVAGGISTVADIKKLQEMGADGVIVGKALYEGKINLKEVNYAS